MKEYIYTINKDSSSSLVIEICQLDEDCLKFQDKVRPLFFRDLEKSISSFEKNALKFLIQEELKFQKNQFTENTLPLKFFHLSKSVVLEGLKLLSLAGKLYFNKKKLVVDLYGKTPLFLQVATNSDGHIEVSGKLTLNDKISDLSECDFLFIGAPHFFIKGIVLKLIDSDISSNELRKLKANPLSYTAEEIKELQEAHAMNPKEPKICIETSAKYRLEKDPLPYLVLKDRTGAFADLWFDDGDKKEAYHEFGHSQTLVEKAFETDLLETDFIKKQMGNSHYYCPLDKVAKSLTFLLEIGWKIVDFKGSVVVRHTDFDLSFKNTVNSIEAKGRINYASHTVNLSDVAGAFNRRDRFIEIGQGVVGLMPDSFEHLTPLIETAEIASDHLSLKKQHLGAISDLFEMKNVTLDRDLNEIKESLKNFSGIPTLTPPLTFRGVLRPYQIQGLSFLKFLYDFHFHGMLADDMGLGKTVQVLSFLSSIDLEKQVLIVLPASLVFNWKLEIERFTPHLKISIHHGQNRPDTLDKEAKIILTTYSTLYVDLKIFQNLDFECLILDEAQTIKNSETKTFKSLLTLNARFKLLITGTPIENHLGELWSHFHFLMPELFGEKNAFLSDCASANSDIRYLEKIKKKIRPFILRRKKEEVAKDLPEKIEQIVYVEMEQKQRQAYEKYLSGIKQSLIKKVDSDGFSKHKIEIFEAILRLRQICCHPLLVSQFFENEEIDESAKLEALLNDIEIAWQEKGKVLVYSQFTSMLQLIAKAIIKKNIPYVYLDGSTKDREKPVYEFQNNPDIPLFLISLKAGGVGLNLTAADSVFLYDPWWNDAIENQAINRAHRIGRQDTVIAKRYITLESIEEKMLTIKKNKGKMASSILDDNDLSHPNLTEEDFRFLLS